MAHKQYMTKYIIKESYELVEQWLKIRKIKYRGCRTRGASFGPLYPEDRILIRNLPEMGGTEKLRWYWEDEVPVIVQSKEKKDLVHATRPETNISGKV